MTLSFLEALVQDGVDRGYAIELTGDVCWRFYGQWGQGTRAATRDPVRRLRLSVNAFLTFPFGRPGYQFHDVPQTTVGPLSRNRREQEIVMKKLNETKHSMKMMWGCMAFAVDHITSGGSAKEILDRRLASGEINLEQYQRLRTALAPPNDQPRETRSTAGAPV